MTEYNYELELNFGVGKLRLRADTITELLDMIKGTDIDQIRKLTSTYEAKTIPDIIKTESISLPEFIDQCDLSSQLDKALAISYYLTMFQGEKLINKNDLEQSLQLAMLSRINNPNQALNDLVTKALLARSSERKDNLTSYYLTKKGKGFVEEEILKKEN